MKKHLLFLTLLLSIVGMTLAQSPDPIVEDFETGDFNLFEWQNDSVYPWMIDTLNPYDGLYCMKSSNTGQANTTSAIQVSIDIPEDCIMSFYSQISGVDYGHFYIDGELKNSYINQPSIPSSWGRKVFDVTAGEHIFRWEYAKDESGDFFDDCFYVDSITFYRHLELPLHGWHTYCSSEFNNAVGDLGVPPFTAATCYTPDIASKYAGTMITKVAIFSDTLYNAVGGNYTCSIYLGGETPPEGVMASTITVDVPQGLNEWVEYNLDTPVWVSGGETIWVVWDCYETVSSWPMGVCNDIDPSGNGNWISDADQWNHNIYGDWTVKTYFSQEETQDQDVYFAGNSNGVGKIWKNDALLYSISDTTDVNLADMKMADDGSIYSAGHTYDGPIGHVWMNDSILFTTDTNNIISRLILNADGWTAAGGNKVWQNGEILYSYAIDSTTSCNIYALALDTVTGDIYAGGSIVTPEVYACVWKNDTILWQSDGWSEVKDLCFDGSNLYAAGFVYGAESIDGVVWQNDSIIFQAEESDITAITAFDGILYWAGLSEDTAYVWQDGETLYSHPACSGFNTLCVNEYGVYYAGMNDDTPTVWKDGEVLYQPDDCDIINALCVKPAPPQPTFTITVESDNPDWGTVSGGGEFHYGDTIQIEALPFIGHEFIAWNDGNVNSPREIVVTQDSTFVALFAISQYTITVESDHPDWGSVTGGGTYYYGDTIEISATANLGFEFLGWTDGNTDNPRTVIVTEDQTFTAHFGIVQCLITTEVVPEGAGTIEGGGIYDYGATAHLVVLTNTGYEFITWDDGVTDNPRTIVVEGDATYTAIFKP